MEVVDEVILVDSHKVLLSLDGIFGCLPDDIYKTLGIIRHLWCSHQALPELIVEGAGILTNHLSHHHIVGIARHDRLGTVHIEREFGINVIISETDGRATVCSERIELCERAVIDLCYTAVD